MAIGPDPGRLPARVESTSAWRYFMSRSRRWLGFSAVLIMLFAIANGARGDWLGVFLLVVAGAAVVWRLSDLKRRSSR